MRRLVLCIAAAGLVLVILALPRAQAPAPPRTELAPPSSAAAPLPSKTTSGSGGDVVPLAASSTSAPVPETMAPTEPTRPPVTGELPASLRGTQVDGELAADASGKLVVTPATRAFFDYFLTASGEEPSDQLKARIVAAIQARLPASAASDAVTLLERYLLYRERVRALPAGDANAPDLELRFRHLRDLRREVFGAAVAEALFGEEERQDAFALEAGRIQEDAQGERRRRLLKELEKELPPEARRARAEATSPLRMLEAERALAKEGVGGEALRHEREARWGEAVADRLEALETARAEWNRRLQAFREARSALLGDEKLNPEQRSSAIAEILSRDFTPDERRRVLALDRIGGAGTR